MNRLLHRSLSATLLIAGAAIAPSALAAQTWGSNGFSIYQLPAHTVSYRGGVVNNSGQVVMTGYNADHGMTEHGIFTPGSGLSWLPKPPSQYPIAYMNNGATINNAGQVAGSYYSGSPSAYIYDGINSYDIPLLENPGYPYGTTAGINDGGQVVGQSNSFSGTPVFLYEDGVTSGYAGLPASAFVRGLNNAGSITGVGMFDGVYLAFIHDAEGTVAFTSGSNSMDLYALNNNGVAGGRVNVGSFPYARAAKASRAGGVQVLGDANGSSEVNDIDDTGRAVGYYNNSGVLWEGSNQFYLDAIMGEGWVIQNVVGISDNGRYIVAYGGNGHEYGGLMLLEANDPGSTVTPEPVSMTLLGTGLAGVAAARRRRRNNMN